MIRCRYIRALCSNSTNMTQQRMSNVLLVTLVIALAGSGATSAAPTNPACPDGVCPGLGHGFYLPDSNVLKANTQGRYIIFKDRTLGTCATVADLDQELSKQLTSMDSMVLFVKTTASASSIGGTYSSTALSVKATASATTQSESTYTGNFYSASIDVRSIRFKVDFGLSNTCLSRDNMDATFLAMFEALPVITDAKAENPSWQAYDSFLKKFGSHVQVSQDLGSRFRHFSSSSDEAVTSESTLKAKACAEVEGTREEGSGWSARGCAAYNTSTKEASLTAESYDLQLVQGGTVESRAAVIKDLNKTTLDAFIDSAMNGTQAIGYEYRAIWVYLQQLYTVACQAAPNGAACSNVQRAVNLQAYYEGINALGCPTQTAAQAFMSTKPSALGISTYYCRAEKEGCNSNDDCHLGGAGSVCYCYGPTCISHDPNAITGTSEHRAIVQGSQSGSYNFGVNNACAYAFLAHCNCHNDWAGGLPSRDLYTQTGPTTSKFLAMHFGGPVQPRLYSEFRHELADSSVLASDDTGLLNLVNTLIKGMLPTLDAALPAIIDSAHLDPYATVTSGRESAGKVNLGICEATAYADYAVKNLVGLKGLQFTGIDLTSVNADKTTITATGNYHIATSKNLAAKLSGSVTAKCGFIHPSLGLSGAVTVHGAQAYGTVTLKGAVTVVGGSIKAQITALTLDSLSASVSGIDVDISSLGIFNGVVGDLASALSTLLKGVIVGELQDLLKPPLQGVINGLLPFPKAALVAANNQLSEPDGHDGCASRD